MLVHQINNPPLLFRSLDTLSDRLINITHHKQEAPAAEHYSSMRVVKECESQDDASINKLGPAPPIEIFNHYLQEDDS